jgi:tetratricopeptide (TPR) repeat protein
MLKKKEANPFGKNPDYMFVKGIDYLGLRDYAQAIQYFERGLSAKSTHLLCRFNLGYTLFKVGHFTAAA